MAFVFRAKSALVATAFLAGTGLMTACQPDTSGAAPSAQNTSGAASALESVKATVKGKGVSGTFTGGTVEYLAPGKHTVKAGGKEQQFFVAEDTKIYGAGTICGEYNPAADTPCTVDEFEKVLKSGSIAADVVMKNGAATTITERPAPDEGAPADDSRHSSGSPAANESPETSVDGINKGKGVNGTWYGIVKYLAPGKYEVSGASAHGSGGQDQIFLVAEDTQIKGHGEICGDPDGQAVDECTEADLEAAAQGGVEAEVHISNGIATEIVEGSLVGN
ncbi:hypothetical protein [Streptomyces sp. NPDC051636]|uniref:hypothetical protein n=1 Tax=Streptomyces sp. NPDC051636 TaxID=3365663 RepID=UPI003795211D